MLAEKLAGIDPDNNPFHDFRNFAYHIFHDVLKLDTPHDIQYDIMEWLMDLPVCPDGIRRGQTQAMRGCGKSVIFCVFCCFLWYCNPTIRIALICANESKAEEFANLIKQILDSSELLEHLRPDPDESIVYRHGKKIRGLAKGTNQALRFDVRGAGPGKDPSFACYPLFGGWAGAHPDLLGFDDIEIPDNSGTPAKRKKILDKTREGESLIMEGGTILYMGTPQTEESVYFKLEQMGYAIRRWPSELPDPRDPVRSKNVSPWLLGRVLEGEEIGSPSYPERFNRMRLIEKKGKGMAYYALQMLLDPSYADAERFPLKLSDLIVLDVASDMAPTTVAWGGYLQRMEHLEQFGFTGDYLCGPGHVADQWEPMSQVILYIDPKGGGADSIGYAVVGCCAGMIYLIEVGSVAVGGAGGTADATMVKLAKVAAKWGVKRVVVESNWGGSKNESAWAKLFQPVLLKYAGNVAVDLNYVSGQKEVRILDVLEPLVGSHRLVVSTQVCANRHDDTRRHLLHQMTHITRDRGALAYDDEIDAVYGGVSQFIDQVQIDPEKRAAEQSVAASVATAKAWDERTKKHGTKIDGDAWRKQRERRRPQLTRGKRWRRA